MAHDKDKPDVGNAIPLPAIIAALVTVAILAAGIFIYRHVSSTPTHPSIVIATGPDSGTYQALGTALQRVLEETGLFERVSLQATDGSVENMQLIGAENPSVDLAFVQGDASPSSNARLLTVLYDEVLHILVSKARAADITSIYDLQGKRVALGTAGSGTRELAQRVLQHFGVEVAKDLLLTPAETAQALREGSIDAAFMLNAIPSRLIAELAKADAIRFLSLGGASEVGDEAHALELVFPGIKRDTIPRSTYVRLPLSAVHTISVAGMLVARKGLDESLVRAVTELVFESRYGPRGAEVGELTVARKIREDYDPANVSLNYHRGATDYYQRKEPPFFVEYAEALSLGLTLLLAIYSVSIALRQLMRRRMKNRVDAYLLQVEQTAADCRGLDQQGLKSQHTALHELRRKAFSDLVAERLLADDAFIILQNHLRDELREIEAALEVCRD